MNLNDETASCTGIGCYRRITCARYLQWVDDAHSENNTDFEEGEHMRHFNTIVPPEYVSNCEAYIEAKR